jgi:hypothetical protein
MIVRKLILLIGLSVISGWSAVAQSVFPQGWAETPVLIQHSGGSGSGFFLQYSNKVFLITAKHVFFDRTKLPSLVLLATNATITAWSTQTNIPLQMTINLAGSFATGNLRGHSSRDVTAVFIGFFDTNGFHSSFFVEKKGMATCQLVTADNETKLFQEIPVGDEIYTFGYPSSIGLQAAPQIDQSRPLVRRGIVASKDPNRRILVLDSPVFKGNSGGPIVERNQTSIEKYEYKVIGIAIEFIPFEERWINNQFGYWNTTISNSGYSIAEPMDSIFEVLW